MESKPMEMMKRQSRRHFLSALPLGALAAVLGVKRLGAEPAHHGAHCMHGHTHFEGVAEHPAPRGGVDGSKVLKTEELGNPAVASLFDEIREIPEVADGVFCYCGCHSLPGHYSLLSCFEPRGAAQWCEVCQGEGRLVVRRHKEGQTLDQIRRAVDARFG